MFDLSDLSDAGAEVTIRPGTEQRARLADWAGVNAVDDFAAQVTLRRRSANRFSYEAELTADIVQSCVVTLEPVPSHLALRVGRTLHLTRLPQGISAADEQSPASDEGREEIQDSHYDLAGPLLEEFLLAIEPYPRCPGVVFEPPADAARPESPFAVLKTLKGPN
jgi:uncharacterized metal-binding protein YceD (DUF177 family)